MPGEYINEPMMLRYEDWVTYIHFHHPNALNGCKTPLLWIVEIRRSNKR